MKKYKEKTQRSNKKYKLNNNKYIFIKYYKNYYQIN